MIYHVELESGPLLHGVPATSGVTLHMHFFAWLLAELLILFLKHKNPHLRTRESEGFSVSSCSPSSPGKAVREKVHLFDGRVKVKKAIAGV